MKTPIFATLFALATPAAFASGVLVPKDKSLPPLAIKHQRVEIDVKDGVAEAKIEQVFKNSVSRDLEAVFVFPLPAGAAVSDFAMHINGKRMSGEIVGKDKARGIYQDIVRRMEDPGLLEHLGNDLFKVSVYPVPKHGEQRIEISYSQPLEFDAGLYKLVYPLKTGDKASQTLEDFTVAVRLSSAVPLKNIYSPSHEVGINRKGDHHATIGFEEDRSTLDRDFVLYYGVSEKAFGLNMLSYAEPKKDGYFMMMISPDVAAGEDERVERDVVFAIDTSGSMRGEKIEQAREALKYCVGKLDDGDRFNVVRFSTDVEPFADGLLPANKKNRKEALEFVSDLQAGGGTAIGEALEASLELQKGKRPFTLVFLTDGKPTIGESDPEEILAAVGKLADPKRARIFVFGVGENLNAHLLDRISGDNGGTSQYIRGEEKIDRKVASFYNKISFPVLSQPRIEVEGVKVRDLHPRKLPDLFAGEQITLFGRFVGKGGDHAVRLTGEVNGEEREFVYECSLPKKSTGSDFIPRLWATRRIGFLLDEIRLHGEKGELRDEVVALSSEFGIVTPYTSYLVLETKGEYAKHGIATRDDKAQEAGGEVATAANKAPATVTDALDARLRGWDEEEAARSSAGSVVAGAERKNLDGAFWTRGKKEKSDGYRYAGEAPATRPDIAGRPPASERSDAGAPAEPQVAVPLFDSTPGPSKDTDLASLMKRRTRLAEKLGAESLKLSEGAAAIDIADKIREYREADAPTAAAWKSAAMRHVGSKIFYRIDGVWTDRDFTKDLETINLKYASEGYFDFLEKHPELEKFFALGEQVIVVIGEGKAVIVEPDDS